MRTKNDVIEECYPGERGSQQHHKSMSLQTYLVEESEGVAGGVKDGEQDDGHEGGSDGRAEQED